MKRIKYGLLLKDWRITRRCPDPTSGIVEVVKMTPAQMHTAIPILLTLDVSATARFYTTRLGFTCRYETPGLAILQRDGVEIHFTKCDEQHLVNWSACRVGVTGIDALCEEYSRQGVLHPKGALRDTDYGTREFGIVDLHGALVTFFENRNGAK